MKSKNSILLILITTSVLLFCCNGTKTDICDTARIDEEPIFTIKNFTIEQTDTVRFYLLDGSFRFRTRGQAKACRLESDEKNNISVFSFATAGFTRADTLVFRTKNDLFFFFTDYHYIPNSKCVLSDTVMINGRRNIGSIIFPHMGIPLDSLNMDLFLRFYWNDLQ